MSGLKQEAQFDRHWQGMLSDYVSAITGRPMARLWQRVLLRAKCFFIKQKHFETPLQASNRLLPRLPHDGQFLAAGGPKRQAAQTCRID